MIVHSSYRETSTERSGVNQTTIDSTTNLRSDIAEAFIPIGGSTMFVLITGSRTFSDDKFVWDVLDKAHAVTRIEHLVLGDCPTGADLYALTWAKTRGVPHTVHVADWSVGRKAGPIRNAEMCKQLVSFDGDLFAVAFVDKPLESSRGTFNTVQTLRTRYSQVKIKIARQP